MNIHTAKQLEMRDMYIKELRLQLAEKSEYIQNLKPVIEAAKEAMKWSDDSAVMHARVVNLAEAFREFGAKLLERGGND